MTGACLKFEKPIGDAVSRIRFAPESNNLLISSWDSSLRLYDVDSFTLRVEVASDAALLDCCFQNESVAFTAGSDCCIRRYDLDSGIHDTFGNHDDLVSCVEYSAETLYELERPLHSLPIGLELDALTGRLITAGWDRKIMFSDTRSKNTLECLTTPLAEVESMAVSGFNLMVAVGSSVHIYDLRNFNKSVYAKELFPGFRIQCVQTIPNSEGFLAGSIDGRIAVEYFNSSNTGYIFWCHPKSKDGKRHDVIPVNDIAFNPSISGSFVTGNHKGHVTTWDGHSKRRLYELPRYPNSVTSLSYSNGGQLLAVASSHTYREGNEIEEPPQIFIHDINDICIGSSAGSSKRNETAQDM